jgi:hypothetical protein
MPGGPPLSLSELSDGAAGLAEKSVAVDWKAGRNQVRVKTCRYGEDFGFFLSCSSGAR